MCSQGSCIFKIEGSWWRRKTHRKRRMNDRVDKDGGLQAGGERRRKRLQIKRIKGVGKKFCAPKNDVGWEGGAQEGRFYKR